MGSLVQFRRYVGDSLINFVNGLGTTKDSRTNSQYVYTALSKVQLEAAYRSDWIARKIITAPAEDATREWREWQASQPQIEKLEEAEKKFDLQRKLKDALIKARLYGGSAIVMGVRVGNSEEELDLEAVKQDDLRFVAVFHQYELTAGERVKDINSDYYGQPSYFTIAANIDNITAAKSDYSQGVRIHPSRVIQLTGNALPDWNLSPLGAGWGDSVLQVVDDALKATGTVAGGIASLIADSKMDVIKIPGLANAMADEDLSGKLISRFTLANEAKSMVNALLLDSKEEWERIQTNFGSMPQLLQQYLTLAAGAAGIPVSRLLGTSGRGNAMNTTSGGEHDTRNYYDDISSKQNTELSPTLTPLDNVLIRSTLGSDDPSIYYEWTPLWQLDDVEKANVALVKAQTMQADVAMAMINPDVLRQARLNQLIEDGFYPGIEDAIDEFGAEPPDPTPEEIAQQLTIAGKTLPPHLGGPPTTVPANAKVLPNPKPQATKGKKEKPK